MQTHFEQECIPVGCVPSAAVAVSARGGVPAPGGGLLPGGCLLLQGGCLLLGGLLLPGVGGLLCSGGGSACSRGWCLLPGGLLLPGGGGSALGGGVCSGGVCSGGYLLLGGCIPACTEADPPVNRMTDRCKNITFATSLRTVKICTEIVVVIFIETLQVIRYFFSFSAGVITSSTGEDISRKVAFCSHLPRRFADILRESHSHRRHH